MKICVAAGKKTVEMVSYLQTNFRGQAEVTVWFPQEELSLKDMDLVILEREQPNLTEALMPMENPPLIVVTKEGKSTEQIRYLPDFSAQFPKLFSSLMEKEPLITFLSKNETYVYRQKDIVSIVREGFLTLQLRSGKKAISTEGFRKVSRRLRSDWFFPVGKDAIVNAMYVSRFCSDGVLMQNGILIPCTQEEAIKAENAFFKTKFEGNLPKK